MAGLYNGHLLEFPQIRVDCFTTPTPSRPHLIPSVPSSSTSPWRKAPNARLYLLTHVHTDHLVGLSNAFTGKIICSPDTKRMLLRLEPEIERERLDGGVRESKVLKYDGLKRRVKGEGKAQRVVDIIETVPYGEAREYELGYDNGEPYKVSITLLDANHCPGSTMFLIRSRDKAVLHTGDVRADTTFIKSLRVNPALSELVEPATVSPFPPVGHWGKKTLDRIYLDTSAVLGTGDMPDRDPVLAELVEQMSMYPHDTIFFLNVWCFGWEQVVKAVASHFRSPIHIDRYKRSIYGAVATDPFLLACTTTDPTSTRFHACERRFKCTECRTFDKSGKRMWNQGKRVVHVNMVEVKAATWDIQQVAFRERLGQAACGEGDWPFNIECPIARHSPLPELQSLVKLFRPRSVSPNCVVPMLRGLDFFLLPAFLKDLLQPGGYETMLAERDSWFHSAMCFVRDGVDCLAALKKQQEMGLDLLHSLEQGGDNKYDDYMPHETHSSDSKLNLGVSRRQTGSDQAMRACQIFDPNNHAAGVTFLHARGGNVEAKPNFADGIPVEADLSDTDNEEHQQKRRRSANGRGRRRHLLSPTSARTRVLSSQARQMSSKRIKTEDAPTSTGTGAFLPEAPLRSRVERSDFEGQFSGRVVREDPTETKDEVEDTKPILPLKSKPRFRVDSRHLAALMAVGTSPPSSPP